MENTAQAMATIQPRMDANERECMNRLAEAVPMRPLAVKRPAVFSNGLAVVMLQLFWTIFRELQSNNSMT
jgi:hypothetical protein